jgi:chromosome segregation ATPase
MSDDLGGFAEWRDSIESRMGRLEDTVETEARLRAQMDRDLSNLGVKLDAQGRLLQALADTQSEHTAILADHTARLTRLEAGMERLEARTERLEAGQATVLAGVQTIIGLLDRQVGLPD